MDFQAISKDDKVKVCRWRLDDKCLKVSNVKSDFIGACCKVCQKYKNEVYYMSHRDDLLTRSKSKYTPRERPTKYKKKEPKIEE